MRVVLETFGINLVNVFGAGRSCGEPAAARGHLHTANRRAVARGVRQNIHDWLAGKRRDFYLRSVQLAELFLLFDVGRCIDSIGERGTQALRQSLVILARILTAACGNLCGQ